MSQGLRIRAQQVLLQEQVITNHCVIKSYVFLFTEETEKVLFKTNACFLFEGGGVQWISSLGNISRLFPALKEIGGGEKKEN